MFVNFSDQTQTKIYNFIVTLYSVPRLQSLVAFIRRIWIILIVKREQNCEILAKV